MSPYACLGLLWCRTEPGWGGETGQLQAGGVALSAGLILVMDSEESKNSQFALDLQVVMKVRLSR